MDFTEHLAVSAPVSAAVVLASGDLAAGASYFVAAVFIDGDHLLDYWRETGVNTDLPRFMSYFSGREPRHMFLFLHAWEWCLVHLALCLAMGAPLWLWAAGLGWLMHLIVDHRTNYLHPLAYFFFFRWRLGFDAPALTTDEHP